MDGMTYHRCEECDNCQYGYITDPCLSPRYDDETEIDTQDVRDENAEFGGIVL